MIMDEEMAGTIEKCGGTVFPCEIFNTQLTGMTVQQATMLVVLHGIYTNQGLGIDPHDAVTLALRTAEIMNGKIINNG